MGKMSAVVVLMAFVMSGCGSKIDHQEVKKAPKNNSELGWIATNVTSEQHIEIMQMHPAGSFRNHGKGFAYEYRGLSKAEILEIAPEAHVEKNKFIPPQSAYQINQAPAEERIHKFLAESPDVEFATENCISNPFLITPGIQFENLSGKPKNVQTEVGNTVGLKSNQRSDDDALSAWVILPPYGSLITSELIGKKAVAFTPDMAGPYSVVLLYKKNGQCNLKRSDFFVTDNTPYQPEITEIGAKRLEILAKREFYQVSSTKADIAQDLIKDIDFAVTKIAVLDSGVNYNNPALKRRMWTNTKEIQGDGVDNDQNGLIDDFVGYDFADDDAQPMDDYGHGSHVAGLVAGENIGTSTENVQIMAVKIGGALGPDLGSIISGIMYAVEQEAQVINMSFSSGSPSEAMKAAIQAANEAGVLVVAASGNGDENGIAKDNDMAPHYPSSYNVPNVLAVASVRPDDRLTVYSNYGLESVHVATVGGFANRFSGPAGLLSSAYIPNPAGIVTQPMAGTSMAAPVAAGVAGLVLSLAPELSPAEVIEILMNTGRKVDALSLKIKSGAVLDAEAAVLSILNSRLN